MIKRITLITLLSLITLRISAQVTAEPVSPTIDDTVTIIYDATQGNGALTNISPVYMHTGVLTTESQHPGDWKYVKTDWCQNTPEVLMQDIGNNKHSITLHIKSYYGIPDGVAVTHLAFVFRNENCTIVGRSSENGDIFYPVYPTALYEDYQSHHVDGNLLTINTESRIYTIQAFSDDIVKIGFYPDSMSTTVPSRVVTLSPGTMGNVYESETEIEYQTSKIKISIQKSPVLFSFTHNGITKLTDQLGLYHVGTYTNAGFTIDDDEAFHGTGFRAIDLNLRGKSLQIYNQAHYGYGSGTKNLNIAIPFIVSSKKYGIYFDHTFPGSVKLGESDNSLFYQAKQPYLSYYFIGAESMEDLLNSYTNLTGKAPLPPRWALGYIQSKFGYETETAARNIVNQLQNDNFPLDALILDLYWFGTPSTMGNLSWDYSRFPTPVDMMEDFREKGVKTILITEPYVTTGSSNYNAVVGNDYIAKNESNSPYILYDFWAGSAVLLDLMDMPTQEWMWNFYNQRIEEGVSGWWCDLGEPENHPSNMLHHGKTAAEVHNYFSWEWSRMLYEKYEQNYSGVRLFNLIRSGYAGMQRFGAIPWSGDIQRSYDGMRIQIPIMLNMGYSGVGYMHSDLGGFTGGSQDNELYTRWMQLGTFSPIMRAHGVGVPTEPVNYPTTYKNIIRSFIQLRYKLLPYNYTLAWENATLGVPFVRAMDFYDIENSAFQNINDQYYWGENMLIAPIVTQGSTSRSVKLPHGKWVNYFTNQVYSGNSTITVSAPISTMPVLVKSGSFLPHSELVNTTDNYTANNLSVWYYPDSEVESQYRMFNDDGSNSLSLLNSEYELIDFIGNHSTDSTVVEVSHTGSFYGMPSIRDLEFRIKNISQYPEVITINSSPVSIYTTLAEYSQQFPSAYFDSQAKEVYVHSKWGNSNSKIVLTHGETTDIFNNYISNKSAKLNIYPNVFGDKVEVEYDIVRAGEYRLDVINSMGIRVATIFDKYLIPNTYSEGWLFGKPLPSGVYYFILSGQNDRVAVPGIVLK